MGRLCSCFGGSKPRTERKEKPPDANAAVASGLAGANKLMAASTRHTSGTAGASQDLEPGGAPGAERAAHATIQLSHASSNFVRTSGLSTTAPGGGPLSSGFRHTSDLRVGVLEGKSSSVTLLNDYIVLGALGKGAYGSVKLCYNMNDDALYALKVLQRAQLKRQLGPRPGGAGSGGALDMLRREVDVMRSMNHPNLIKIYEVIEHTSKVVLVQEYAEAGPLAQPDQAMSEQLAQFYFRQIVAGLAALHAQNVVHGDMKPDNVLLAGSGLVKIADFGQAHFFDAGTDVFHKTLGTPAFMAPEIRSGDAYHGMPADMWALGITLYSFLFGDVPFKGATLDELYEAIQSQPVQYPAEPSISDELRSVLDGLLSKDPAQRPTAANLMHHPWVAEDPEEALRLGGMPLELDRMDDAPSLEKWVAEMAFQEQEVAATPQPLAQEVAVKVFGRDLMAGRGSFNTRTLMDAIQETAAPPSAGSTPIASRMHSSSQQQQSPTELQQPGSARRASPFEGGSGPQMLSPFADSGVQVPSAFASGSISSLPAQAAPGAAAAAGSPQRAANGAAARQAEAMGPAGDLLLESANPDESLDFGLFGDSQSLTSPGGGGRSQESMAEELSRLLADIDDQLDAAPDPAPATGASAAGPGSQPEVAASSQQQQTAQAPGGVPIPRPRREPVAREQTMSASASLPPPPPLSHASTGASLPSPHHQLSHTRNSLPVSPFESSGPGVLDNPGSSGGAPGSLAGGLSPPWPSPYQAVPAHSSTFTLSAAARRAAVAGSALPASTADVWEEMRRKTEANGVAGVRFVQFPAGHVLDPPTYTANAGNFCLLIESGQVNIRYVAQLGTLPGRDPGSGGDHASSSSSSDSDGDGGSDSEEEARLERRDTLARGPEARAIDRKTMRAHGVGGLEHSASLRATVERVLSRAERLLGSATSPGETNLLISERGPNDFVGIGPMLEPKRYRSLSEKWARHLVCLTEVTGAFLSRPALELLLRHYPLAQVYLRITLSKGRAEMLQLEALENIASVMAPRQRSRSAAAAPGASGQASLGGGPGSAHLRLDVFRAISFARRLAKNVADEVVAGADAVVQGGKGVVQGAHSLA